MFLKSRDEQRQKRKWATTNKLEMPSCVSIHALCPARGLFGVSRLSFLLQTRGWFYTLTVLGAALFDKPAFKNLIVNGLVLASDGKKMSKRLKNYPGEQTPQALTR